MNEFLSLAHSEASKDGATCGRCTARPPLLPSLPLLLLWVRDCLNASVAKERASERRHDEKEGAAVVAMQVEKPIRSSQRTTWLSADAATNASCGDISGRKLLTSHRKNGGYVHKRGIDHCLASSEQRFRRRRTSCRIV